MVFSSSHADSGSALYPPGLRPLISRANALLSIGQFSDAAQAYSEAIGYCTVLFLYSFFSDNGFLRSISSRLPPLL